MRCTQGVINSSVARARDGHTTHASVEEDWAVVAGTAAKFFIFKIEFRVCNARYIVLNAKFIIFTRIAIDPENTPLRSYGWSV